MLNMTLYKREMKGSLKLLILFAAIISMYVTIIIRMYDPEMMATLDSFYEIMPELMASVGMSTGATSLIGFMISYLYGFILLIFPMVFCILRGNGLIAQYVDKGSMVTLLAAPIKRSTIAITQVSVLISGTLLLMIYATGLEVGNIRAVNLKRCSCMPAFIYWGRLLFFFLHIFRYEIQYCFRGGRPRAYVCPSNVGKCW